MKFTEVEKWYDENQRIYEQFSSEMEEIISKILESENIPYQSISYRVKDKDSYLRKSKNNKYTNPIEEIMDISGIRVIAYTNLDVQLICDILKREFLVDEENSINKAEILDTDRVGYLSIHYILQLNDNRINLPEYKKYKGLKCEVQVRTLLQHAWAEIEHDRNYKFAGVLPNQIKRRFHLIAGVLEMMDSEFDKLSLEIDQYTQNMNLAVSKGDYNFEIDSKSLEQYVLKKFEQFENIEPCWDDTIISEEVVKELLKFGYKYIYEIDNDFNKCDETYFIDETDTYLGVLRNLMIIIDCEKYFNTAYSNDWGFTTKESIEFFKSRGVDNIEEYFVMNGIEVEDSYLDDNDIEFLYEAE